MEIGNNGDRKHRYGTGITQHRRIERDTGMVGVAGAVVPCNRYRGHRANVGLTAGMNDPMLHAGPLRAEHDNRQQRGDEDAGRFGKHVLHDGMYPDYFNEAGMASVKR